MTQLKVKPRLHDTAGCQNGLYNWIDNRLYRVNGVQVVHTVKLSTIPTVSALWDCGQLYCRDHWRSVYKSSPLSAKSCCKSTATSCWNWYLLRITVHKCIHSLDSKRPEGHWRALLHWKRNSRILLRIPIFHTTPWLPDSARLVDAYVTLLAYCLLAYSV